MWDDEAGYDLDDPKHPRWAEVIAGYAGMVRKREKEGTLSEPEIKRRRPTDSQPRHPNSGSESVEGHEKRATLRAPKNTPLLDRVRRHEGGCWEWLGSHDPDGYARWSFGRLAHRAIYEEIVGPIPEGLTIDHLCRNRGCVNPAHLEPVTHGENMRRAITNADPRAQTHCVHGHEFTPKNTYRHPGGGGRSCRKCGVSRNRKYRKKNA